MIQSSAKRRRLEDMPVGKSLMYIRNSKGPRTLPSGTPDVTSQREEVKLLADVNC